MTTRSSATAIPVAPTPTEIQSLARSSAVNSRLSPSSKAQCRLPVVGSSRSRMAPVAADQPAGELHDLLEDLGRIAQRRDAGRDLAQRLFRLGPPGQRARATDPARR